MFESGSYIFLEGDDGRGRVILVVIALRNTPVYIHVAATHHVGAARLESSLVVGVLQWLANIGLRGRTHNGTSGGISGGDCGWGRIALVLQVGPHFPWLLGI